MGLRTAAGVALADLAPLSLDGGSPVIATLREAGLLEQAAGRIAATAAGRMVLDRLTAELALTGGVGADQALPRAVAAV